MPELPEVETTLRGLRPHLLGRTIAALVVRERRLRWPLDPHLEHKVRGRVVTAMARRGKYLVIHLDRGGLLAHLGMSGAFRVLLSPHPPAPHEHYDLITDHGALLRYRDPRRFGCLLWSAGDPLAHPRLLGLGVEPLERDFDGAHLHRIARTRRVTVKQLLMDGHVVVGVGNIYACEALHAAAIHPLRRCHRISEARYLRLAAAVRKILRAAIRRGGVTLRDFTAAGGQPGYFAMKLKVYGRTGEPCRGCGGAIRCVFVGQRSTFYCPACQR